MRVSANEGAVRTTIYLDKSIKNKIDELSKKHLIASQTQFINNSLQSTINQMQRELDGQRLIEKIRKIKRVKPSRPIEESIRELRQNAK